MISVTIIIPAWDEEKTMGASLRALLDVAYDKDRCEIVVVAGGGDNTYELAQELSATMGKFSKYTVIVQEPKGKNAAIQQGIKEAKNDIIVLLDTDTIVSEQWLKHMVAPIEQGTCDLTIANPEPLKRTWVSHYYMIIKTSLLDSILTYSGNSMAFKAEIVKDRLEYFFDRNVKVGVDYLLAKRFMRQGLKVVFARDASVLTYTPSSFKYFVLTELRWLTALINIDGVSYRALACNTAVVAALILAIPVSKTLFILSLLFNVAYMFKKARMFLVAFKRCNIGVTDIFGFIMLSYAYHVIGFISYIKYFLGLSGESYLYQGQR